MKWANLGFLFWRFSFFLKGGWETVFYQKSRFHIGIVLVGLFLLAFLPVSEGLQIRAGCQFVGSLFAFLE